MSDIAENTFSSDFIGCYKKLPPFIGKLKKPETYTRFITHINAFKEHDAYGELHKIRCPALVLKGWLGSADVAYKIDNAEWRELAYSRERHLAYENIESFSYHALQFLQPLYEPVNLYNTTNSTCLEMNFLHQTMVEYFKNDIILEEHYGPVQMGVYGMKYCYKPRNYTISINSERGFCEISIINADGKRMVYRSSDSASYGSTEERVKAMIKNIQADVTNIDACFED